MIRQTQSARSTAGRLAAAVAERVVLHSAVVPVEWTRRQFDEMEPLSDLAGVASMVSNTL